MTARHPATATMATRITGVLIGALSVSVSVLCGCQRLPLQGVGGVPQSHGGPVRDHVSFVDNLRAAGYVVSPRGNIQQPFFRPGGTLLDIRGNDLSAPAEVQSFNYDDRDLATDGLAAAQADAAQILPDGQPKTAPVTWSGPPHFFRKGRLIVLYLGDDPVLLRELQDLLGPQFAGA